MLSNAGNVCFVRLVLASCRNPGSILITWCQSQLSICQLRFLFQRPLVYKQDRRPQIRQIHVGSHNYRNTMEELYRTVKEQVKPIEAVVEGEIPTWLNGSLLRNGPAMYEVGPEAYKHWFDGLGMLQNFKVENGKVTYCSRYLRSQAFVLAEQRRGIAYAEFGTPLPPDPCKNIFARFFSYFSPPERTDNCSISVVSMNGQTYASSDSPFLIGFDPSSLQSLSEYNIRNDFPGIIFMMFFFFLPFFVLF